MINVSPASVDSGILPRIYANKIVLSNGSSTSFKKAPTHSQYAAPSGTKDAGGDPSQTTRIDLELYVQDILNIRKKRSNWIGNRVIRSRLVVKALLSTNKYLTRTLSQNYFDTSVLEKYNKNMDYQFVEISLSAPSNVNDRVYYAPISQNKKIASLIKDATFTVPFVPEHLTLFFVAEILPLDSEEPPPSGTGRGPVTIEKVIKASSSVSTAVLFKDSKNQVWAGPVHRSPSSSKSPGTRWMEGYSHTSAPHGFLTRQVVNNFKLVDMRIIQLAADKQIELTRFQENPYRPDPRGDGVKLTPVFQENPYRPDPRGDGVKLTPVSELYLTRNSNGSAVGVFNFNCLEFLTKRSKFSNLIATSSPAIQAEILSNSEILSFKITRERVTSRKGVNRIQSASDLFSSTSSEEPPTVLVQTADHGGALKPIRRFTLGKAHKNEVVDLPLNEKSPDGYHFFGAVEEIKLDALTGIGDIDGQKNNLSDIRSFTINDGMFNTKDGLHQYSIECTMKDGTYRYLDDRLGDLQDAIGGLRRYLHESSLPSNFDEQSNCFSPTFIESQLDASTFVVPSVSQITTVRSAIRDKDSSNRVQPWIGAIVKYIEALSLLTNINDSEKKQLASAFYSLVSPVSGNPDGIRHLIRSAEGLESKLSKILTGKVAHLKDKSDVARSDRSLQTLEMRFKFSQIFDATPLNDTAFYYFGTNSQNEGILKIRAQEMVGDIQSQLNNLAKNSYDANAMKTQFDFVTKDVADAFFSNSEDLSYIAPMAIGVAGHRVDLWSKDSLDYVSLTAVIQDMSKGSTGKFLNMEPKKNTLKLLTEVGKGPDKDRMRSINKAFVDNAIGQGIIVGSTLGPAMDTIKGSPMPMDPIKGSPKASSIGYMGKNNQFTSAPPKEESLTAPVVPYQPEDVLAILDRVLSIDNVSRSPSFKESPLSNISFDLSKTNNFFTTQIAGGANFDGKNKAQREVVTKVATLPTHIKRLTTQQGRYYNDPAASLSTNEDAQTDGFMYNFGMLRVVEYLDGYRDKNMQNPIWRKMTPSALSSLSAHRVCRIRKIIDPTINVGVYGLMDRIPVSDEYFLLRGSRPRKPSMRRPNARAKLPPDALGYRKVPLLSSAESGIFVDLVKYEVQQKVTQYQDEYALTAPQISSSPYSAAVLTKGAPGSNASQIIPGSTLEDVRPTAKRQPVNDTRRGRRGKGGGY